MCHDDRGDAGHARPKIAWAPRWQRRLARYGTVLDLDAGRALTIEDDLGREAFVIFAGTASVTQHGLPVATVGPGDIVGELAALGAGHRTATVTATTPMTVLVLTPAELSGLLDRFPTLTRQLLATIAYRLSHPEPALPLRNHRHHLRNRHRLNPAGWPRSATAGCSRAPQRR